MFWRRRAWTPTAAMSPCRAIATAWTCTMAAMTSLTRTGLSAPCRATAPRTWRRITRAPAQSYAERRGITFRERVERAVEIVKQVPEKVRGMFDGLRLPADGGQEQERAAPERKKAEDPEEALRRARTRALVRHARAVDAIFEAQERGGRASPEQVTELQDARKAFEEVRPYGPHDAEAAYKKNPELASEAATGQVNRTIRALQLETELRTDPQHSCGSLRGALAENSDRASQRQYQAGDISGYKSTRSAMGDMAKSLERDPQLESILEGRKRDLGIGIELGPQPRSGTRLQPRHRPRQRPGYRTVELSYFPPPLRHTTTTSKYLLHNNKSSLCLVSAMSETPSRRQRNHARSRPYRPHENRSRPRRPVPFHHLPQDRRGHVPRPGEDQRQWCGLA